MLDAELRAEVRDDVLYLDYAVVNRAQEPVELGGRLARNALHSSLTHEAVLHIRRPFGDRPVRLAPGARFEETLELPLPVPPRHPIAQQPEGPPHEVGQVSLAFDYHLGDERIKTTGPVDVTVRTTIAAPG
jgi:hypothetical protein